jgi:hypothetical protein
MHTQTHICIYIYIYIYIYGKMIGGKVQKKRLLDWAWWCTLAVPAAQEMEIGGNGLRLASAKY